VGHGVVRIAVAGAEVHAVRRAYQAGSYEATAGVWRLTGASKYSGGSASFQASHWGKPNVQCRSWLPLGWPSRLAPCHMSQPRTVHPRRLKHRITSALGGSFCGTADGRPRDYGPKNQDPDQGQGLGRNRDPGQDCPQAGEEPDDSASRALHALSLLARQIVLPPARGIRYSRLYCKATARAGIPRTKHSRVRTDSLPSIRSTLLCSYSVQKSPISHSFAPSPASTHQSHPESPSEPHSSHKPRQHTPPPPPPPPPRCNTSLVRRPLLFTLPSPLIGIRQGRYWPAAAESQQPCSAAMHKEPKSNDSNVEHVTPGRPSAASSRIDAL